MWPPASRLSEPPLIGKASSVMVSAASHYFPGIFSCWTQWMAVLRTQQGFLTGGESFVQRGRPAASAKRPPPCCLPPGIKRSDGRVGPPDSPPLPGWGGGSGRVGTPPEAVCFCFRREAVPLTPLGGLVGDPLPLPPVFKRTPASILLTGWRTTMAFLVMSPLTQGPGVWDGHCPGHMVL